MNLLILNKNNFSNYNQYNDDIKDNYCRSMMAATPFKFLATSHTSSVMLIIRRILYWIVNLLRILFSSTIHKSFKSKLSFINTCVKLRAFLSLINLSSNHISRVRNNKYLKPIVLSSNKNHIKKSMIARFDSLLINIFLIVMI